MNFYCKNSKNKFNGVNFRMVNHYKLEHLMQDMSLYIMQMETLGNHEYMRAERRRIIEDYNLNQQEQEFSRYWHMCRNEWLPGVHGDTRYRL